MLMRLLLLPMLAAADDTVCSFQKQPKIEGLLDLDTSPYTRVKNAHPNHPGGLPQDLWSSPGLGFRQCPTKSSVRTVQLLVRPHSKHSPEAQPKPKCLPKEVLIGDFVGDAYEFSCCDAGEQCGGCRAVKDGACQKCAAGYVMQTIPVLGTSKCFVCDDVPNWHDMHGRSCADLQKLGICSGAWPKEDQDVAFQGVRPSEACCACGGGSIYPTPVYMPLQSKSLHFGQSIDETPSPITAGEQMVAPGCTLASSGLELGTDGRISGEVTMSNQTVIKCSTMSVQDPVRGIVANIDLSVPVSTFSYGEQTVFFKFWGLDSTPSQQIVSPQSKNPTELTSFQLQCDPACPWLSITSKGHLLWNSTDSHVPHGRAGSPVAYWLSNAKTKNHG
ncbi:Uncharacterized protein SCF082_LOCUS38735 [Durusdinium trenchii]|uniref:Uncharacterized protein n=1 Tax=Durusdinium trenchii TaxID=1381693 RepID=A0ABP0Q2X5_9DINO